MLSLQYEANSCRVFSSSRRHCFSILSSLSRYVCLTSLLLFGAESECWARGCVVNSLSLDLMVNSDSWAWAAYLMPLGISL